MPQRLVLVLDNQSGLEKQNVEVILEVRTTGMQRSRYLFRRARQITNAMMPSTANPFTPTRGTSHTGRFAPPEVASATETSGAEVEAAGLGVAVAVAEAVTGGGFDYGVLICGTGIGMCMAANKVRGIRAALCHTAFSARRARQHNDANICCLAAEEGKARVLAIIETFLTTEFEGGRHQERLNKIREIEEK